MKRVLVTGANGFVGKALCQELVDQNYTVVAVCRQNANCPNGCEAIGIPDINSQTDWTEALVNVDTVIHLAARVHVMKESSADPLNEFRKVNVEGTRRLASQAAIAGVKRLVYVSSIKVNGECTAGKPFDELDAGAPEDAYGISKYEAELALHEISTNTGLEVVIIRPPLIYGPGVKGNFQLLANAIKKGFPFPFASVKNLRSLLFVGNLVQALILCASHPKAAGQTYIVSDGEDISTPDLVKSIADVLGVKAKLLHCPPILLKCLSGMLRKKDQIDRLLGSLQVSNLKLVKELGWKPDFSLREGLSKTFGIGTKS
jgi:nucleoside-diphosphate-sugar epimerase